jgi:hypothetical protein
MTIDALEILWTIAAVLGLLYGANNLWEAIKEYRLVVKRKITNGRRLISIIHIRTALARSLLLVVMTTFAAGNVIDLFGRTDQWWIDSIWILITIMFMICAIMDTRNYAALIENHKKEIK